MAKKIIIVDENQNSVIITRPNGQKENFAVEVAYKAEDFREKRQGHTLQQIIMPREKDFTSSIKIDTGEGSAFLPIVLVTSVNGQQKLKPENNVNVIKPDKFENLINSINNVTDIVSNTIRNQVITTVEDNYPKLHDDIASNKMITNSLSEDLFDFVKKISRNNDDESAYQALVNNTEITFRRIKQTDHVLLHDFYNAISQESIAFEKFQPVKTFPDESIQELINTKNTENMALASCIRIDGEEKIIGFTYYNVDSAQNSNHLAILVQDDWQTKGVSSLLLEIISEIAKDRNICEFDAVIYKNRKQILPLFYNSGHEVSIKKESNVYKIHYKINRKWIRQIYNQRDGKASIRLEDN